MGKKNYLAKATPRPPSGHTYLGIDQGMVNIQASHLSFCPKLWALLPDAGELLACENINRPRQTITAPLITEQVKTKFTKYPIVGGCYTLINCYKSCRSTVRCYFKEKTAKPSWAKKQETPLSPKISILNVLHLENSFLKQSLE